MLIKILSLSFFSMAMPLMAMQRTIHVLNSSRKSISHMIGQRFLSTVSPEPQKFRSFKPYLLTGMAALGGGLIAYDRAQKSHREAEKNRLLLLSRPPKVQAAVDKAFMYTRDTGKSEWLHNGAKYYGLVGIDEDKIPSYLAHQNPTKKDVYIIDVGCATGQWGEFISKNIQMNEDCKKSGKRFHVFSITGGQECDETIKKHDHVTLYQFNQFKIENIDEELAQRGFDLRNKVDFMVSNWTLRHLADPIGTLKRMHSLLAPTRGTLLSSGFLFAYGEDDPIHCFPHEESRILSDPHSTVLFRKHPWGRSTGQFMLVKNSSNELNIPLAYTGEVRPIGYGWQCESYVVTLFKKEKSLADAQPKEYIEDEDYKKRYQGGYSETFRYEDYFCTTGDEKCKKLYDYLKSQKLFFGWDDEDKK